LAESTAPEADASLLTRTDFQSVSAPWPIYSPKLADGSQTALRASNRPLPFAEKVKEIEINPRDSVMTNAAKLAALGGGGTSCSAPLQRLVQERASAEFVVLVSDNQSWVGARAAGPTETLRLWEAFRVRNPQAKLVCIDLQPNRTTQAIERPDVLNVGGFSDEVFEVVARFADGTLGADHWVGRVEAIEI
jgi:60 kDa SS-A/Ro ribonucleoprotein